jgi:hypothetical protein
MLAAKHCPLAALQRPSVHRLLKAEQSFGTTMSHALLSSLHCSVWQGLVELHTRGLRQCIACSTCHVLVTLEDHCIGMLSNVTLPVPLSLLL